jgi:hypothetical protein
LEEKEARQRFENMEAMLHGGGDGDAAGDGDKAGGGGQGTVVLPRGSADAAAQLWVQTYSPRAYLQLLSDERVNVAVLAWLKSWHAAVFGAAAGADAVKGGRSGEC